MKPYDIVSFILAKHAWISKVATAPTKQILDKLLIMKSTEITPQVNEVTVEAIVKEVSVLRESVIGMISHKMSLITIFGPNHKIKNFIKNLIFFMKKISMAFGF